MLICNQGHEQISYQGERCPLCKTMGKNEKLIQQIENLKIEILFTEGKMTFCPFCGFDREIEYLLGKTC